MKTVRLLNFCCLFYKILSLRALFLYIIYIPVAQINCQKAWPYPSLFQEDSNTFIRYGK